MAVINDHYDDTAKTTGKANASLKRAMRRRVRHACMPFRNRHFLKRCLKNWARPIVKEAAVRAVIKVVDHTKSILAHAIRLDCCSFPEEKRRASFASDGHRFRSRVR
ncbi:hypothetical protein Bphy_5428 [Paraburkholderia phymatum STM815]|uniref:Uncharacterized protein n=1 Tax=Paraburkholderia phymatum (strain DSM 17167 / CIP 108236 / LMG 21445 / STM815) TaxID=391038 RepID=B2JNK3_PARP8|nr:hypothetical protein Bphy_5428 [Paraburkholderia phymatum STM815]